jgi:DNA replication protein DnaC
VAGILEEIGPVPCPTEDCDGTGQRIKIAGRTEIDVICAKCQREYDQRERVREHEQRVEHLMLRSGKTPLLASWSLDTFRESCGDEPGLAALAVATRWAHDYLIRRKGQSYPNLWLYGPVGGGKTGLAWGVVRLLIEHEVEARFVHLPDLLEQMRDAFAQKRPTHEAMYAGSVPVLAVDDVGAERTTPWAIEQLLLLVDRRRHRLLPTIFTSNYEPDELAERLDTSEGQTGERIVSRMIQGATQYLVAAPDRRLTG